MEQSNDVTDQLPAKRACIGHGLTTTVLKGDSSARELLDKVRSSSDVSGGIVPPRLLAEQISTFSTQLVDWATALCNLGDPVSDELFFWEGHSAQPDENVRAQFRRQLSADFAEMADAVSADVGARAAARIKDPTGVAALQNLVDLLLDLYEPFSANSSCSQAGDQAAGGSASSSDSPGFCLRLEINDKEECSKFHDDCTNVRFEIVLVGDGTVLAQGDVTDWSFWKECEGEIELPEEISNEELDRSVREWNSKVCPESGEIHTEPLSLVVMKGGNTMDRPCVHRAAYDAAKNPRFIVSLEQMTGADMKRQREMLDLASGSGSDEHE